MLSVHVAFITSSLLILIYVLVFAKLYRSFSFNVAAENTRSARKFNDAVSKSVKNGRKISFLPIRTGWVVEGGGWERIVSVYEVGFESVHMQFSSEQMNTRYHSLLLLAYYIVCVYEPGRLLWVAGDWFARARGRVLFATMCRQVLGPNQSSLPWNFVFFPRGEASGIWIRDYNGLSV